MAIVFVRFGRFHNMKILNDGKNEIAWDGCNTHDRILGFIGNMAQMPITIHSLAHSAATGVT